MAILSVGVLPYGLRKKSDHKASVAAWGKQEALEFMQIPPNYSDPSNEQSHKRLLKSAI